MAAGGRNAAGELACGLTVADGETAACHLKRAAAVTSFDRIPVETEVDIPCDGDGLAERHSAGQIVAAAGQCIAA